MIRILTVITMSFLIICESVNAVVPPLECHPIYGAIQTIIYDGDVRRDVCRYEIKPTGLKSCPSGFNVWQKIGGGISCLYFEDVNAFAEAK